MDNKLTKTSSTQWLMNLADEPGNNLIKADIIAYTAKLTVATALQGEQMSTINRRVGQSNMIKILNRVLTSLNDSINIGTKMNSDQIFETSVTILNEHWSMKLDEVLNCLKMAKNGYFGKIYGIDQPTIMGWLKEYDEKHKGVFLENRALDSKTQFDSEDSRRSGTLDDITKEIKERAKKGISVGELNKKK